MRENYRTTIEDCPAAERPSDFVAADGLFGTDPIRAAFRAEKWLDATPNRFARETLCIKVRVRAREARIAVHRKTTRAELREIEGRDGPLSFGGVVA
ncbi:hypothetical protein BN2476_490090 [Paraburkholderia piptadeniae]|uniref:Uncharacterized protein n=1 Tax=Paraburkholderia piptadeniae TaxID=1701573 RepID=A0A1N7SF20_9BURK|nr:hypothetical protein BN2476_490090 [Paraburkholderia piptadeniae]